MSALWILGLGLACDSGLRTVTATAEDTAASDTGAVTDTGGVEDTGGDSGGDSGGVLCDGPDGPQAVFLGAGGAAEDLTALFLSGTPEAPLEVGLYEPGQLTICAGEWDVYLRIEADVAVRGAGPGRTTLNAHQREAVVRMRGDFSVDVSGLTLTGGLSQHGGGLYATQGISLRMSDCVVDGNSVDLDGHGGGVCISDDSEAAITGVSFLNNTASEGGGLAVMDGVVSLVDVYFEGNTAREDKVFPGYGGGFYTEGSEVAVTGASFVNNTAASAGGGLAVWYSSALTLRDASFTNNSAGDGGGLHVLLGDVIASGVSFLENRSTNKEGGGAVVRLGSLTLSDATLGGGEAEQGGGIAMEEAHLTLTGVSITGNTATTGGGLYLDPFSLVAGVACAVSDNSPDDIVHPEYAGEAPGSTFTCDATGCR